MVVYLDVLFIINLYVTYFQILALFVFTHRRGSIIRMISAGVAGGVFSLVIFIPEGYEILCVILKVAAMVVICLISCGYGSFAEFLKNSVLLLFINFVFAGLCLGLWLFWAPLDMLYSNGTVYFNIDFFTILVSTSTAYGILRIIRFFLDRNGKSDNKYSITVQRTGREVVLEALCDSGNGLVDCFSGLPVIVCKKAACMPIIPSSISNAGLSALPEFTPGIRILPFRTVSSEGYIYAFKADKITVTEIGGDKKYSVNALIGIAPDSRQEYDAIFNPKILV